MGAYQEARNEQYSNLNILIFILSIMMKKSLFHLDCNPIIPGCGYQCIKCVEEIRSVLESKDGVSEVTLMEHKNISIIAVEYESEIIGIKELEMELERLPSFYTGFFIPKAIEV